jgi:hypothetical protein
MFEPPIRKKDVYVSRIKSARNKTVRIRVNNLRFIGIHPLEGNMGFLLKFAIPIDSCAVEEFKEWDQKAFQATLEHFPNWFPSSGMTSEQIEQCFRSSVTPPCILTALASSIKQPIELRVQDQDVTIPTLFAWDRQALRQFNCSVDLEAQGLYFYPKRFGIRWMIRSLRFAETPIKGETEDLTPADKTDLETELNEEIQETIQSIRTLMESYRTKLRELEDIETSILTSFENALSQPAMNKNWNQSLENVRSKMTAYQKFLS